MNSSKVDLFDVQKNTGQMIVDILGSKNDFDGGDTQNCRGGKCNQNNGAVNEGNGGTTSGGQRTLNCPPGSYVSSSCTGTHCVVACGNSKQVGQC